MRFFHPLIFLALCCLIFTAGGAMSVGQDAPPQRTAPASLGQNAPDPATPTPPLATGGQEPDDIRDIRGPISILSPWTIVIIIATILLGFIIIGLLVYAGLRYRNKRHVPTPQEIALEQLAQARLLIGEGKPKEFSIAVSDCVRVYIEKRFHERAAHRTTEEFLNDMLARQDTELTAHNASLADFLHYCDLAKFARWSLTASDMEKMLESAKKFVEQTKPVETESKA